MGNLTDFIVELKRRRVFRVVAYYAGFVFVIIQIMDGTFDLLGIPDWAGRLLITLLAIGFPIAMILSWVYDITDRGIVRTKGRAEGSTSASPLLVTLIIVSVITILATVSATRKWWSYGSLDSNTLSIAVLPFANWDGISDDDYFADGMTEELISRLTRIPNLHVIAHTSVMQYKGSTKRIRQIGEELGVGIILSGSVRRATGKVRITGQLIDARTERHLWTDSYDREVDEANIFYLQDEVARKIAGVLEGRLAMDNLYRQRSAPTTSMAAYDLYLRGKHHLAQRTPDAILMAIVELRAAIEADTNFVYAYAELANAYNLYPFYIIGSEPGALPGAAEAINHALRLDPESAEAYAALAAYEHFHLWNMERAEQAYLRVIALNPGYAPGRHWYGIFLADVRGDLHGSLAELSRARSLDPRSPIINTNLGDVLFEFGRYQAAEEQYWQVLEIDPNFSGALYGLGLVYMVQERFQEAEAVFIKIGSPDRGWAYAALGKRQQAEAFLDSLFAPEVRSRIDPVDFLGTYGALGMEDSVVSTLNAAIRQRSPYLLFWRRHLLRAGLDSTHAMYKKVQQKRSLTPSGLQANFGSR